MEKNETIYQSISEKISLFQDKIRTIPDSVTLNRILESTNLTEEEFELLYSDWDAYRLISAGGKHYLKSLMESLLIMYPWHGDKILATDALESWQVMVLEKGYFSDVSAYNMAALSQRIKIAEIGAKYCDSQTLKKLVIHKSKTIREIVYQRLGPTESLNEMLNDPSSVLRAKAVSMAPVGYSQLNDMKEDIALEVTEQLVSRIDASRLPFMMGNRNVSEKIVASRMDLRMRLKKRSS